MTKDWDDMSESEQLTYTGFCYIAALAQSLVEQLGEDHVKDGLFLATHRSSPSFEEEDEFHDGGVGQRISDDWFVAFSCRSAPAGADDPEEVAVVIFVGESEAGLETDLDTLLEVAEDLYENTGLLMHVDIHEYNSPGGDA